VADVLQVVQEDEHIWQIDVVKLAKYPFGHYAKHVLEILSAK